MAFEDMQNTLRQIIGLENRVDRQLAEAGEPTCEPRAHEKRTRLYASIQLNREKLEDLKHQLHCEAVRCGVADYSPERYGMKTEDGPFGSRIVHREDPLPTGSQISLQAFTPEQVEAINQGLQKCREITQSVIAEIKSKQPDLSRFPKGGYTAPNNLENEPEQVIPVEMKPGDFCNLLIEVNGRPIVGPEALKGDRRTLKLEVRDPEFDPQALKDFTDQNALKL